MHISDRCRICAGLLCIDKGTCEVYFSLFESESKALWNVDIGKDCRPKSNWSRFPNRLANDRKKHMNPLERLIDTRLTKAAFSPNCLAGCIAVKKLQLQFLV